MDTQQNWTLSRKIVWGFTGLILLSVFYGMMSFVVMKQASSSAQVLAKEDVPFLNTLGKIQKKYALVRLAVRAYSLTGEEEEKRRAMTMLASVKEHVAEATVLSQGSTHLKSYQPEIASYTNIINSYYAKFDDTIRLRQDWQKDIDEMIANGSAVIASINELYDLEVGYVNQDMTGKVPVEHLKSHVRRVALLGKTLNECFMIRMAVSRSIYTRSPESIEINMGRFETLEGLLREIIQIAENDHARKELQTIQTHMSVYKTSATRMIITLKSREKIQTDRVKISTEIGSLTESLFDRSSAQVARAATRTDRLLIGARITILVGLVIASVLGIILVLLIRKADEARSALVKELERSNHELEQFAYVASHDLQEPLRMVASYTQLISDKYQGRLDEKADKYIFYAVDGARRMQGLIRDLLSYAKVHADLNKVSPVNCRSVVDEVIQNLGDVIKEKHAVVQVGWLPTVTAERTLILQLFQNLIGNAVKFSDTHAPVVEVRCDEVGNEWVFKVKDNGIGIDPEHHERIFRVFQRLHDRKHYQGTGIGLAIVKKIVEQYKGRVWVESTLGKGACFLFTFPKTLSTTNEHEDEPVTS